MLAITAINRMDLPLDTRLAMMKAAGFDGVMLYWGADREDRAQRVHLAKKHGLAIPNAHATGKDASSFWLPGENGDALVTLLEEEITDAARYGVDMLILHLVSGGVPALTDTGFVRIGRLVALAEKLGVRLAFENTRSAAHVQAVLQHFSSPCVGFCYDAGHHNLWDRQADWLPAWGERLLAVHLQDNRGEGDSHLIPFDGDIDWQDKMRRLAAAGWRGPVALECEFESSHHYDAMGFAAYLSRAAAAGRELEKMLAAYSKIQ